MINFILILIRTPTQQEIGLPFSKYDINFKFEFEVTKEDDKIKNIIIELYNS